MGRLSSKARSLQAKGMKGAGGVVNNQIGPGASAEVLCGSVNFMAKLAAPEPRIATSAYHRSWASKITCGPPLQVSAPVDEFSFWAARWVRAGDVDAPQNSAYGHCRPSPGRVLSRLCRPTDNPETDRQYRSNRDHEIRCCRGPSARRRRRDEEVVCVRPSPSRFHQVLVTIRT